MAYPWTNSWGSLLRNDRDLGILIIVERVRIPKGPALRAGGVRRERVALNIKIATIQAPIA